MNVIFHLESGSYITCKCVFFVCDSKEEVVRATEEQREMQLKLRVTWLQYLLWWVDTVSFLCFSSHNLE